MNGQTRVLRSGTSVPSFTVASGDKFVCTLNEHPQDGGTIPRGSSI